MIDPVIFKGYLIQPEIFEKSKEELSEVYRRHFNETERGYRNAEFNINYEYYESLQRSGNLYQIVVRSPNGSAVGYFRAIRFSDPHAQQDIAVEDAFYILPEHRQPWLPTRVVKVAEEFLKKVGVKSIHVTSKLNTKLDKLYMRQGFHPVAVALVKHLDT